MKLSALFLAATLGVAYAAPISLIYITNNGRTIIRTSSSPPSSDNAFHPIAGIRFGHAAAYAQPNAVNGATTTTTITRTHSGCGGLRAKMDKFREMFGLAPVVKEEEEGGFVHIMPVPHPYRHDPLREDDGGSKVTMMHYRIREQSFWDRVHHALNQLGPWEGITVMFVLGCGLATHRIARRGPGHLRRSSSVHHRRGSDSRSRREGSGLRGSRTSVACRPRY
ncbi:hypothetical protein M407DRAFT_184981 [Tulasnella calospora MUT 4182]|uniref:Uncharacterized protein n=1 Tax=Tulasnella calospora MUT 4182 TaxID=1051891 RepID=A0A0C3QKW0_9AGAM|nr:hypothetical protein M407DRAFT_184981 [Tulasnella calospora MUT 4182]